MAPKKHFAMLKANEAAMAVQVTKNIKRLLTVIIEDPEFHRLKRGL